MGVQELRNLYKTNRDNIPVTNIKKSDILDYINAFNNDMDEQLFISRFIKKNLGLESILQFITTNEIPFNIYFSLVILTHLQQYHPMVTKAIEKIDKNNYRLLVYHAQAYNIAKSYDTMIADKIYNCLFSEEEINVLSSIIYLNKPYEHIYNNPRLDLIQWTLISNMKMSKEQMIIFDKWFRNSVYDYPKYVYWMCHFGLLDKDLIDKILQTSDGKLIDMLVEHNQQPEFYKKIKSYVILLKLNNEDKII